LCCFVKKESRKARGDFYKRKSAKGNSKKLALVAVCHKLLKQAFAIAKSGLL
jgi:transposase